MGEMTPAAVAVAAAVSATTAEVTTWLSPRLRLLGGVPPRTTVKSAHCCSLSKLVVLSAGTAAATAAGCSDVDVVGSRLPTGTTFMEMSPGAASKTAAALAAASAASWVAAASTTTSLATTAAASAAAGSATTVMLYVGTHKAGSGEGM